MDGAQTCMGVAWHEWSHELVGILSHALAITGPLAG
jgi:hypothetical protein